MQYENSWSVGIVVKRQSIFKSRLVQRCYSWEHTLSYHKIELWYFEISNNTEVPNLFLFIKEGTHTKLNNGRDSFCFDCFSLSIQYCRIQLFCTYVICCLCNLYPILRSISTLHYRDLRILMPSMESNWYYHRNDMIVVLIMRCVEGGNFKGSKNT